MPTITRVLRGRELGGLLLAGAWSFLSACGAPPTPLARSSPPPTLQLDKAYYVVGLRQSVTAIADVTGTTTPVTWSLECDSGRGSIVPSGNSATLTGLHGGSCVLWASLGELGAGALVSIPPLAPGDPCHDDSQCSEAAAVCGLTSKVCGKTCTQVCTTNADCTVPDRFGHPVSCTGGLCILIRDPDWTCP